MKRVDLNVDIGEGFPHDEALLEFATSANICCGEHAGSWELTRQTIDMCLRKGIRIGCHPGFPDRKNMGRNYPTIEQAPAWCDDVVRQSEKFCKAFPAAYIKLHGAWYNIEARRYCPLHGIPVEVYAKTDAALDLVWDRCRLPFLMIENSFGIKSCRVFAKHVRDAEVVLITEGFADRRYNPDGTLVSRSQPNAILEDPKEIAQQVLRIAPEVASICLHGDTPNCLKFAELVNKTLVDAGYEVGF